MTMETIEGASLVLSDEDRQLLKQLRDFLRVHRQDDDNTIMLHTSDGQSQDLPPRLVAALLILAGWLAKGEDVALVPVHKELTTQEAAALLNVSRPFLVKLLDDGVIPSAKAGTHRRVRLSDVLAYQQHRSKMNKRLLDEMLSYAQEHGGYD